MAEKVECASKGTEINSYKHFKKFFLLTEIICINELIMVTPVGQLG